MNYKVVKCDRARALLSPSSSSTALWIGAERDPLFMDQSVQWRFLSVMNGASLNHFAYTSQ